MENNAQYIIESKALTIGYKTKRETNIIAKDLNLSVIKGKMICVLGKNGIGKSTLLRTFSKVQPKLSGEIYLNGKLLESTPNEEVSKRMSLVLTERIPESNLSVYELIALGRQPYTNWLGKLTQEDYKKINEAIALTKIEDLIAKRHHELSDGQYQKVMITRSLAQDTDIITLDEPTAHLDLQNKIELFQLLKYLTVHLNKTLLISTHEVQLAIQLSDELWLMTENGLICGTPDELVESKAISKLFRSDHIKFDDNSKQFIINGY